MANITRSLSTLLSAAMFAACSAGVAPSPQAPPLVLANGAHHEAKGRLVLRIHVPRKKKAAHAAPRYISSATEAITIAITGPTDVKKTAALTPNAAGCSRGLCTVTIPGLKPCSSTANCYAATIATYDAVTGCPSACTIPETAHELSGNQSVLFTIAKAQANQLNVTLDGFPTSVVLVPAPDATLSGNMASGFSLGKCNSPAQEVSVLGLDADDNYILGAGAPTPTLMSDDAVDLPVTATPSPSSPNRFMLTPPARVTAKVAQLIISATPLAGSGASPVTTHVNVTFGDICGVYVGDFANSRVKEMLAFGGSFPVFPTINTLGSGFSAPRGVAVDGSGNVFVADFGNNAVKEIEAVGGSIPASPTINTLGSGFSRPSGVAVDGSGNVFVADTNNNSVKEILAVGGSIPTAPAIHTLYSGFSGPVGVAVDGSGNVYVADTNDNAVREIQAVGGIIPPSPTVRTLGSGFNQPFGVAVDASRNVYVADTLNDSVEEMLAVGGIIPSSPTIVFLDYIFSGPSGVAVDGSGDVYVTDSGMAVKEILAVGGSIPTFPTVRTLGSGFLSPMGIALR